MTPPAWNVIYHSINSKEIKTHNVLAHGGVRKDIVEATKKCKTKEEFGEKLRSSLMYYYWGKCEWEILITPWCGDKDTIKRKIDVYEQVMFNWELFLDYVWNERKNIKVEK